jgi:hypothetical protein
MSEPEWSLPMNRAELIARIAALEAASIELLNRWDRSWGGSRVGSVFADVHGGHGSLTDISGNGSEG